MLHITFSHHIQIFLRTRGQHRYRGLNDLLGIGHGNKWLVCNDPYACWNYCGEEKEDPSSRHGCASQCIGVRPRPSARRGGRPTVTERSLRLGVLRAGLLRGERLSQLVRDEQCFELFIKHPSGIKFVQQLLSTPENTPEVIRKCSFTLLIVFGYFRISVYTLILTQEWSARDVYVYWGATGTGKSRAAREYCQAAGLSLWVSPIGAKGLWYDGYDGHDCALFDDFSGEVPFRDLLCLLEGNRMFVPVKGGFVCWRPTVVIFTCDRPPNEWSFQFGSQTRILSQSEYAQLERRLTEVRHFPRSYLMALGMPGGGGNTEHPPQVVGPIFTEQDIEDILYSDENE